MRVLGIDPGERRIGLALSDESGILASPVGTLERRSLAEDIAAIRELVERHGVGEVVVGVPVSLSGRPGPQARRAQRFAARLAAELPVPVRTWDEAFSTVEAERYLSVTRRDWRERKRLVDAVAAAVILQSYLDSIG